MENHRPHQNGLRLLARREPLTDADWFALIETRRALMARVLRSISLKSLGDLRIVTRPGNDYGRTLFEGSLIQSAKHDFPYRVPMRPRRVSKRFPLETRAIFPPQGQFTSEGYRWERIPRRLKGTATACVRRFWGLTRDNEWIKVEVPMRYYYQARSPGFDDRIDEKIGVVRVTVTLSNPEEICRFCKITPKILCKQLRETVEDWQKQREILLGEVTRLVNIMHHEEETINVLPLR